MKKIVISVVSVAVATLFAPSVRAENPFMDDYQNQVAFNFGWGVDHGFIVPPPTRWVPFNMLQFNYSQPATFFRMPARQSIGVVQTLGHGQKYGWSWDKYTIPIAMLGEDVALIYGDDWYTFAGVSVGMQLQQNERIGSKLIFGFKLGAGYKLSPCVAAEVYAQHYSNGNTAPENNSYAFYGVGLTYSF